MRKTQAEKIAKLAPWIRHSVTGFATSLGILSAVIYLVPGLTLVFENIFGALGFPDAISILNFGSISLTIVGALVGYYVKDILRK